MSQIAQNADRLFDDWWTKYVIQNNLPDDICCNGTVLQSAYSLARISFLAGMFLADVKPQAELLHNPCYDQDADKEACNISFVNRCDHRRQ